MATVKAQYSPNDINLNPGVSDGYVLPEIGAPIERENKEGRATRRANGHTARRAYEGQETFIWDGELPGFRIRCYPSGRKRWVVQFRHRGVVRHKTIGDAKKLSAEAARQAARSILADVALDGLEPRSSGTARSDLRLADFVEEFWRDYSPHWKPSTRDANLRLIERSIVPRFGRRQLASIKAADISASWH